MVLIGLLLAALVCIVLGVVFASAPWLVGSLGASLLAGFVLWRQRTELPERAAAGEATASAEPASAAAPGAAGSSASDRSVWVVDGLPQFHRETCRRTDGLEAEAIPFLQATEDGFLPCTVCELN